MKFRAVSLDQQHWYASVYVEYAQEWVNIQASPCFAKPEQAIEWAIKIWA